MTVPQPESGWGTVGLAISNKAFPDSISRSAASCASLAETLLREVSLGRRPVTATATVTESGRWTLEVVEDGAETPRSGWIVY
uniref:hypothetical protein n=1 Tax=Nocardia abscessus TaxID=120957 RepID=UPI0024544854